MTLTDAQRTALEAAKRYFQQDIKIMKAMPEGSYNNDELNQLRRDLKEIRGMLS